LDKLFHLANKHYTILAYEEAAQLLIILQAHVKHHSISDDELENIINKMCYALSFGRNMTADEEIELLAEPNQILIDD
jgi:hypothetical protein